MLTPDELVKATYDYLVGAVLFNDLYNAALDFKIEHGGRPSNDLAPRLAGIIVLAEAEESTGLHGRDETRRLIAEILREETMRAMKTAS